MNKVFLIIILAAFIVSCDHTSELIDDNGTQEVDQNMDTLSIDTINLRFYSDCNGLPAVGLEVTIMRSGLYYGEPIQEAEVKVTNDSGDIQFLWYIIEDRFNFGNSEYLNAYVAEVDQTIFLNGHEAGNQDYFFYPFDTSNVQIAFQFPSGLDADQICYYKPMFGFTEPFLFSGPLTDTIINIPGFIPHFVSTDGIHNGIQAGIGYDNYLAADTVGFLHVVCDTIDLVEITLDD